MKANRHDYDNIFSVCVLYAAHFIFSIVVLLNIQRVHVSAYYRVKINYKITIGSHYKHSMMV